jgi:hypothetical protein
MRRKPRIQRTSKRRSFHEKACLCQAVHRFFSSFSPIFSFADQREAHLSPYRPSGWFFPSLKSFTADQREAPLNSIVFL